MCGSWMLGGLPWLYGGGGPIGSIVVIGLIIWAISALTRHGHHDCRR